MLPSERAFPGIADTYGYGDQFPVQTANGVEWVKIAQGLSIRDWFAGLSLAFALQDAHHGYEAGQIKADVVPKYAAKLAYATADAMLAERAKEQP